MSATATATAPPPDTADRPTPSARLAAAVERALELVRTDRVVQVALGMVALQLVLRAWAIFGAWFILDDYNFISRMGHDGLGLSTAARSYLGHVMPGAMYLSWFNHVAAPWQWWLPATELLVLQAAADLTLLRLLVVVFGRRPGILPPLALFLFSVISLEGALWWAAAINLLPLEIAMFTALTAHVTYLRSARLRHAVLANGCVAAGLLFNEKTALVYLLIALVTLCWFARGYGWARLRSAVAGRVAGFAVYVATGAAYVVLYLLVGREFTYGNDVGYPTYEVTRNLVVEAFVPALVGGPLFWHHEGIFSFARPGDAVVLASLVVVGLVVNELVRHRVRATRALALPLAFLVVDVVLVLTTRTLSTGPSLVLDYRFQGELAAVTAIALAGMAMPIPGAVGSSRARSSSELLDHPRRVALLCGASVVLALGSSIGFVTNWHSDRRGQEWVQNLTTALDRSPAPLALVDREVPDFVLHRLNYPENLASRLLVGERNAQFVDVATDDLRVIDDEGRLAPALVPGTRRAVSGPVAGCGYRVGARSVRIPLDGPVSFDGFWVRIGYLSTGAGAVTVTVGDRSVETTVRPGVHALFVRGGGSFDSVQLSGLADPTFLCTDDVSAGVPQPLDQPDDPPNAQGAPS